MESSHCRPDGIQQELEADRRIEGVRRIHEPEYQNGDIIYVDPDVAAVHGKDVVVRLGDRNEVTFKRLVVESERRYLKPLNPNWPDEFMNIPADARIVGVVVGKYADK